MMELERKIAVPEKRTTSKCASSASIIHSDAFSVVHNIQFCGVCSPTQGNQEQRNCNVTA